jgi:hypothetical protein
MFQSLVFLSPNHPRFLPEGLRTHQNHIPSFFSSHSRDLYQYPHFEDQNYGFFLKRIYLLFKGYEKIDDMNQADSFKGQHILSKES